MQLSSLCCYSSGDFICRVPLKKLTLLRGVVRKMRRQYSGPNGLAVNDLLRTFAILVHWSRGLVGWSDGVDCIQAEPIRLQSVAYRQPIELPPMDSLTTLGSILPCQLEWTVISWEKKVVCAATLTDSMFFLFCYGHVALLMYVNEFMDG